MTNSDKLIRSRVFQKLVKNIPDKKHNIKVHVAARPAINCIYLTCRIVETPPVADIVQSFYVGFVGQQASPCLASNIFKTLFLRSCFDQQVQINTWIYNNIRNPHKDPSKERIDFFDNVLDQAFATAFPKSWKQANDIAGQVNAYCKSNQPAKARKTFLKKKALRSLKKIMASTNELVKRGILSKDEVKAIVETKGS